MIYKKFFLQEARFNASKKADAVVSPEANHHNDAWWICKTAILLNVYDDTKHLVHLLKKTLMHERAYNAINISGGIIRELAHISETKDHLDRWTIYNLMIENDIFENDADRTFVIDRANFHSEQFSSIQNDQLLNELGVRRDNFK